VQAISSVVTESFKVEEIMRKRVLVFVLVLIAATGCSQQRQEPKSPAGYPGGPAVLVSPEVMRALEQTAKQSPKNAAAWTAFGNALMDSNRYGEAADAYQKALALDPKNVDVRVDMGTCLKNSGRPQLALEEYRKASKLDPNHLFAHRNMGVVLAFDLKDKKEAVKEFEKYLALAPNAPDAGEIRQMVQNLKSGQ
jgi:tetratricopeptide (TPR) repeat protein